MSVPVFQSPQARLDYWKVVEYLAERNLSAAERFMRAVKESFTFLADWPETASRVDTADAELANLRLWPVLGFRNYLIVYRFGNDKIDILHLTHASRDLDALLKDT